MAVSKLSQIATTTTAPASTDQFVGVQSGTTDVLFTTSQIVGGTSGAYQYNSSGTFAASPVTISNLTTANSNTFGTAVGIANGLGEIILPSIVDFGSLGAGVYSACFECAAQNVFVFKNSVQLAWSSGTSDTVSNLRSARDVGITRSITGAVKVTDGNTGLGSLTSAILCTAGTTVTGLTATTAGARAFVTDGTATTFMSTVTGGGTIGVPVVYNGSAWKIG